MTGKHSTPSASDSLVLDIGGDIGALIIYTGPELVDTEIDLSPEGDDDARFHNMVHPRQLGSTVVFTAVYPAVEAGTYTVWRDRTTRQGSVTITGGHVTEHRWN